LTGTGQGAAAWIAQRSEDRSYLRRTSSGSLSMRTNIVGTSCEWVTLYFSTSFRYSSGSKCSIITTVPPRRCTVIVKRSGAAW
jgi:hypothetical protein